MPEYPGQPFGGELCAFDSETIGNPAFDLGDVLTFSGGQADGERLACITFFHCKIDGKMKLKYVGKNPRLAQVKSKNDKNISGLLNQIEAGKMGNFSGNAKLLWVKISKADYSVTEGGLDAGQRKADVGGRAGYDQELSEAEMPVLYNRLFLHG